MRSKTEKTSYCKKQMFSKHHGICKTYSILQTTYAEMLESDPSVKDFEVNVPIKGTSYTSDFLITQMDGSIMVRECILHLDLVKPRWLALLDLSRNYWVGKDVDWGLVADKP